MTLIGCRCRGGDVHSRAVLIALRLCLPRGRMPWMGLLECSASSLRSSCLLAGFRHSTAPPHAALTVHISGGFCPGAPPLPIPNREVKPGRADGTAPQCGRVGRRRLFVGELLLRMDKSAGSSSRFLYLFLSFYFIVRSTSIYVHF